MSIIIKGLDMPKSCEECNFNSDSGFCLAMPWNFCGHTLYEADGFPDFCPLVEIPKGNGRLIDGDELKKHYATYKDYYMGVEFEAIILEDVDNAPTILEAEE